MTRDFAVFRARSNEVPAQSWATVCGTMVHNSDGGDEPWLKVFAGLRAVASVMGWPSGVLPVLPQPSCSLLLMAVATVLDVGELWLYDWRLRRVILVAEGQRCMAVLVGPKQFALVQGDDAPGRVAAMLLSVPDGYDNASAEARLTSDPLHLVPVVEAWSGGQQLVLASSGYPAQAGVDVLVDVIHDYGWRLLAGGKPHLQAVRWTRLLDWVGPAGSQFRPRRHHGTNRCRACSIVPPLVPW